MARQTNADRVIEQYMYGGYAQKSDKLRIDQSGQITSFSTPIAYIFDEEYKDRYEQMLVISLQNFKSQSSWKSHQKSLVRAANKYGIPVIFVPELDIGFGTEPTNCIDIPSLIKVAKYTEGNDIKTAACGVNNEGYVAYSCAQCVNNEWLHAESLIAQYWAMRNEEARIWYSMLEPCSHCLRNMINQGAQSIIFSQPHKAKWNTLEYIDLTNELSAKRVMSSEGKPVIYGRQENVAITKFYNGGCK